MQKIDVGIKELCRQAKQEIDELSPEEANAMAVEAGALIVDIRDIRELWRDGAIPGALHAPRGMLEFWIDPDSPYHKTQFSEDRAYIFCCAGGLRSALATQTARLMGLQPVYNLTGGYRAWQQAGCPTQPHEKGK